MTTRYELGIDFESIEAIDMHVHLEVDECGHKAMPEDLFEASAAYFKSDERTPSIDRIA